MVWISLIVAQLQDYSKELIWHFYVVIIVLIVW
ncbi:hypothetical protein [Bullifex porci]